MKKRILSLAVLLLCLICTLGHADFGDFSGGSDYGGSDSSYDSDWSSSYDYHSDYDSDGEWSPVTYYVVVGILLYVLIVGNMKTKKSNRPEGAKGVDVSALNPVSDLENFSPAEFNGKLSNMYIRLQEAWANGDLTPVEPLLTAPYYAQMAQQLKRDFIDKGITSHLEHISVLDVQLLGCIPGSDDVPDRLYAQLKTRFVNYLTDRNGKIVRGDKNDEIYMTYEWTLERSANTSAERTVNCPNCAAPVDANRFARCPFCDSVIENSGYDWVISQIKGISRETQKH